MPESCSNCDHKPAFRMGECLVCPGPGVKVGDFRHVLCGFCAHKGVCYYCGQMSVTHMAFEPSVDSDDSTGYDPDFPSTIASETSDSSGLQSHGAGTIQTESSDAASAPAQVNTKHCLCPGANVLTWRGTALDVLSLEPGIKLFPSLNGAAVVHAVRHLPERERDIVHISFVHDVACGQRYVQLDVTASHLLAVKRGPRAFEPMLADRVQRGDFMRGDLMHSLVGSLRIEGVVRSTQSTSVIEVELEDSRGSFFVCGMANDGVFVECYGALAPLQGASTVKILSFARFNGFREALLLSPELRACREDLERSGFSADLSACGGVVGTGKMFVLRHQAFATLLALYTFSRRVRPLRRSDVVVSMELEHVVRELALTVSNRNPTATPPPQEVVLDVSFARNELELGDLNEIAVDDAETASSTDVHLSRTANPRFRARALTAQLLMF